jgi:hypothetical protein
MKPDIIGRQVRRVTPGGFVNAKNRKRRSTGSLDVRAAANRALAKRGVLNRPSAWENPVFRAGKS